LFPLTRFEVAGGLHNNTLSASGIMISMSEGTGKTLACLQQQELMADVQRHLMEISKLTRAVAQALEDGNETTAAELDKQVDIELGKKERAMGALHQHRKEHNC
jgi:hypothetical protein